MFVNENEFFIPEFTECAYKNDVQFEAIASRLDAETRATEIGADIDIDLSLIIRGTCAVSFAQDDIVRFRGTEYRVYKVSDDSANVTRRLFLISRYGGA